MDGTLYYVHQDLLGSTVAVSDAGGQAVGRVQYDPYGEVLTSTLPVTLTDRLFTGAQFDGTIGLYQMGARWYDPALGRWIQADTIVPNPTNPQDLNRYTYVRNNPLRYTDPSGHWIFEETPGDPWIWYSDKPANTLIRTAEPVAFWEEFHQPTDAELFAVATSPFWTAGLVVVPHAIATDLILEGGAAYLAGRATTWWLMQDPLTRIAYEAAALEAYRAFILGDQFNPENAMFMMALYTLPAIPQGIKFGQTSVGQRFTSPEKSDFKYAGWKLEDVAAGLRSGQISPDELLIQFIERDSVRYAINNRSLKALRMAGMEPTVLIDITGHPYYEPELTRRLDEAARLGVNLNDVPIRGR